MENYILVLANFYLAHTAAVIDNQNLFNWNATRILFPVWVTWSAVLRLLNKVGVHNFRDQ